MACLMQRSTPLWCLFDSTTREVGSTDIILGHSPLEATDKGLGEEEALFDCFNKSWIQDFGDVRYQGYGEAWWRDPSSKTWG